MDEFKTPPHSVAAEQALIGAVWQDEDGWDRVADLVGAVDFYRAEHRLIWESMQALSTDGKTLDVLMVMEHLQVRGELDAVGGMDALMRIDAAAGLARNAASYAQAIRDRSVLRQLITTCNEIQDRAFQGSQEALEMAASRFALISEQGQRSGPQDARALLTDAVEYLDERFQSGESMLGQPTGYADLDAKLSGLQPGELIILAGRPSMGKSTVAQNIADHAARTAEYPVVFFSLEMSARTLTLRTLSAHSGIDHDAVRGAKFGEEDWQRVTSAVADGAQAKLYIDDTSGLSVSDLVVRARRLHRQHGGLSLIVVDYLQLLSGDGENRNIEIMRISQALKGLSKTLNCPVLALSQLNRSLEQRPNKRPRMSDLRDSGGLEQDADVVLFVYRDEVYNEASPDAGTAELIIGKHRNGETGTVRLAFDGPHCAFRDLARGWEPQPAASNAGGFEY